MRDRKEKNKSNMESVQFKKVVDKELKSQGFIKKGNSWYSSTNECIVLLNLQHSNFSSFYYINLCSFLRKRNYDEKYPKETECHIRTRVPNSGEDGENYLEILDLTTLVSDEKRELLLIDMIHKYCLPYLLKLSSIEGIKELYKEEPSLNYKNPYTSLGFS